MRFVVAIPNYNHGETLVLLLSQLLKLNFDAIYILDDASTDNSLSIIKEYEKNDSRIKVVSLSKNTPGGAGIPSNIGIEQAKGEYIGFVDSDEIGQKVIK